MNAGGPAASACASGARRRGSRWGHFWLRALPAYWLFLFCVTHFPKLRLEGVPGDDKTAHVLAYALLAFLIWQFRAARARPIRAGFVLKAWGLVAAYATVDELTQPLVGRSADIYDWLADLAGATAALAILEWRRRARTCNDRDVRALG